MVLQHILLTKSYHYFSDTLFFFSGPISTHIINRDTFDMRSMQKAYKNANVPASIRPLREKYELVPCYDMFWEPCA